MLKNCHVSGCKCPQQIIEVECTVQGKGPRPPGMAGALEFQLQ